MFEFLKRCKKVKVSENFDHLDVDFQWLKGYEYFYISYDGTCFDQDGYTICNFGTEEPFPIQLSQESVNLNTVEVI